MQCRLLFLAHLFLMVVIQTDAQEVWTILSGSSFCSVSSDGMCITDGSGPYANNENCAIRAEVAMSITATEFATESCCDRFTVGATAYSGTTGPTNEQVAAGTVVTWFTDSSVIRSGWTICATVAVTARNDPHFRLPHGGRTDIRGEDGAIYNLLSAKNVSLSALFEAADFTWSKRSVHGTKMAAAFWVIRTYSNDTVTVSYTAAVHGQERYAIVSVVGAEATDNKLHVDAAMPFKLSNLAVTLVGRKLIVETDKWQMAASADPFPFAILNKGKVLMNIEVTPKYDADKDVVAPHGIFGQAYDDDEMAVNGAVDSPTGSEWTTKAQGEGAIEGSIAEYKLADGFSTDFKYSRFDAVRAPHRDVSKLTGPKEKRGKGSSARVEHYAEPEPSAAVGSD